jgi:alpha-1,3-mannosyltransferase
MFVSASEYEGFGVATIEAMSAATVVVVTPVGAHPDVIHDKVNGFIIDQNATTLSETIGRVLEMPQHELSLFGEAARSATRRFSWTNVAPHYEELYREVITAAQRKCTT